MDKLILCETIRISRADWIMLLCLLILDTLFERCGKNRLKYDPEVFCKQIFRHNNDSIFIKKKLLDLKHTNKRCRCVLGTTESVTNVKSLISNGDVLECGFLEDEEMRESEPGKWVVGAGLLVLGFILIIGGVSFAVNVNPLYGILMFVGIYLIGVVINDQVIRNCRLKTKPAQ
jgi:hypothetical protein